VKEREAVSGYELGLVRRQKALHSLQPLLCVPEACGDVLLLTPHVVQSSRVHAERSRFRSGRLGRHVGNCSHDVGELNTAGMLGAVQRREALVVLVDRWAERAAHRSSSIHLKLHTGLIGVTRPSYVREFAIPTTGEESC